ncbi:hypothetical protein HYW73_01960 [Candidatus Nomurabacteria bacterium]|nr:hypothetical protein [Candidatus Nomurabacteria bacterium]
MKINIYSLFLFIAVTFGVIGFTGIQSANAQTASFPAGCASGLGYSVTTANPCNGTSTAYVGFLFGCSSALGYSTANGAPCSGGTVAISYLAGCSSIYGYSTINGWACNGAYFGPAVGGGTIYSPGFPTTGLGGNALNNIFLLAVSGLIASLGLLYLSRRSLKY